MAIPIQSRERKDGNRLVQIDRSKWCKLRMIFPVPGTRDLKFNFHLPKNNTRGLDLCAAQLYKTRLRLSQLICFMILSASFAEHTGIQYWSYAIYHYCTICAKPLAHIHRSRWNQLGDKNEKDWLKCRSITDLFFLEDCGCSALLFTATARSRSLQNICLCHAVAICMAVSVMLTTRNPSRHLGREVLEPACTLLVSHLHMWVGCVLSCQGVEPTILRVARNTRWRNLEKPFYFVAHVS